MSELPTDPVEVYRARNLPEAHAIRLALEQQGIAVRIDNELLQGAVGELPMGWITAPRLMVDRARAEAAAQFIENFLRRPPSDLDEVGDDESASLCLACRAEMGEADACPSCGWTYGPEDAEPEAE